MAKRREPIKQRSAFNKRKEVVTDKRLSVCVPCNRGIFEGRDDYVYTNTGYKHIACLESHETPNAA